MSERLRVVFMGCPEFAVPCLRALADDPGFEVVAVYTMPDRPKGRGNKLAATPVKEAAQACLPTVPVLVPTSFRKDPAEVDVLRGFRPDFLVVVAYGLILPPAVLAVPRLAPVNVHASLLPNYRGPSPIHWALMQGDSETGTTIMRMSEGMDEGAMLAVGRLPIHADETISTLHDRLRDQAPPLLLATLRAVATGTARPVEQDHAQATYTTKISSGLARLDWRKPAAHLERLVRAMTPCPGAWFEHGGERIKVSRSRILGVGQPPATGHIVPGSVFGDPDETDHARTEKPAETRDAAQSAARRIELPPLRVVCGDGLALELLTLQRPGREAQPAEAFLRGYGFTTGERLALPTD